MLPKDLTRDIIKRVNGIQGQLKGLSNMLEEGQDPEQIRNQFKAVQKGLDKTHSMLLDEVYRKALAIKIVEANEACPGNCGCQEQIRLMKEQFPHLNMEELTKKMKEIDTIAERLARSNKKKDVPESSQLIR